jgi:hypothetical protein
MFPEDFPSEGEIDARVARVFANGNAVHERLGVYLRMEPSLRFVDEVDVPRCELDIHGRCDGIVDQNDQMVIVEFKSINKLDVPEPKVEHVGQVTLYMHQFTMLRSKLREEFGVGEIFDVEHLLLSQGTIDGEVIYETKGEQKTVHFPVKYDEGKAEVVMTWFRQLKSMIDRRRVPRAFDTPSKFPCSWGRGSTAQRCPYYEYCHAGKQGVVDDFGRKNSVE